MIVILSGEDGKTDFGQCTNAQGICSGDDYQIGPMAIIVDKMLAERMNYSIRETTTESFLFVSKAALIKRKKQQKGNKVSLVGIKQEQETAKFYINAWMLAEITQEIEQAHKDIAIAVLFRDCDRTNSTERRIWDAKWQSMINGFQRSGFSHGIPMLPNPKSEAWLICAAKDQPYQHCDKLEEELSGNDKSPNSAKTQLKELLGLDENATAEQLCDWLAENPFDFNACEMPSFKAFKDEFNRVLDDVLCQEK